jgi:hypothetical protein
MKKLLFLLIISFSFLLVWGQGGQPVMGRNDTSSVPEANHYFSATMGSKAAIVSSGAADTTGITPTMIGAIYVDTNASKVYIAKSKVRGGWLILNTLWFLLFIRIKHE